MTQIIELAEAKAKKAAADLIHLTDGGHLTFCNRAASPHDVPIAAKDRMRALDVKTCCVQCQRLYTHLLTSTP